MMRIALLYICTGQYVRFWEEFYESFHKNFLRDSEKSYFVFTDSETIYGEDKDCNIHRIYQKDLGWPGSTLFRFRMFSGIAEELKSYDYVFFMNANLICLKEVKEADFLPVQEELLVVKHPGYDNLAPYEFPYERRRKSKAFVPYTKGHVYAYGAINGGKSEAYIRLIRELKEAIQDDYGRGIIAKWHDESHLNKYIIEHDNYKVLPTAYAYSEEYDLPYEKIILVTDKKKKIKLADNKIKGKRGVPFAGMKRKMIGMYLRIFRKCTVRRNGNE